MKFCSKCGKEVEDEAQVCVHCGCWVAGTPEKKNKSDGKSILVLILSLLIPILGLILYLVWKDEYPLKARSAGQGAIIGVVIIVAGYLLSVVSSCILLNSIM